MNTKEVAKATFDALHQRPFDKEEIRGQTWLTRGTNFVIAVTPIAGSALLVRDSNPDEYMVLLSNVSGSICTTEEVTEVDPDSLVIVPPGQSSIRISGIGYVVRVFSNRAEDLANLAENHHKYCHVDGSPPLVDIGPAPLDGSRVRQYGLDAHLLDGSNMRVFRSSNLMINVLRKRSEPRDVTNLGPHAHEDFEQASLTLEGTYVHHLRYPWSTDMTTWREDEHVSLASPAVVIIPPTVVHASQNTTGGISWMIDVFSPPRADFCRAPGLVRNSNEYPAVAT
ncbi:hypothetical protein K2O51_26555 [Cupriavidus pinatubonensis]|uniref:hypothetical protein n=1 Tax=Cupriavidus pinatubonensis TaxID=248026 RepID=UPI001C72F3BE|nr:hypothetical protein [Cupriavidus pinatubonensis]QYY30872.1 hypothetical protein K2O51_26555 [Cupriavidus pinatubonensis]